MRHDEAGLWFLAVAIALILVSSCQDAIAPERGGGQVEQNVELEAEGRSLVQPPAAALSVEMLWRPALGSQWRIHRLSDGPLLVDDRFVAVRFRSGGLTTPVVAVQFAGLDWCGTIDVPTQPSASARVTYGDAPGTFPTDAERFELAPTLTYEVISTSDHHLWLSVEMMPEGGGYGAASGWFQIRWDRPTSDDDIGEQ